MNSARPGGGNMRYVCVLTLVAALGGLLFGYDTAVIAGVLKYLQVRFSLTPFWEGFAAAAALAGCALGAGSAGLLSDRFGRKKVLLLAALAFFVSALGTAVPRDLATFIAFRLVGGVGIGAASIISPMYIAEITPFRIRGRMVSLNQFAIISGMLIVYFVNYFIAMHGAAVDSRQVLDNQRKYATTDVDKAFAAKYLAGQVDAIVDKQIEDFLVKPRKQLDRSAVAACLAEQGIKVAPADIAPDDAAISPGRARDLLRQRLPGVAAKRIDRFLATAKPLNSVAVARFLKPFDIKVDPTEVDLAAHGAVSWNVTRGWRWMFASGVFPSLLFLVLLLLVPESPRWLTAQGRRAEALAILTRVDGPDFAAEEIRSIEAAISQETGRWSDLWQPRMRAVLVLGVGLAVLQQVTGINVFLYFAPQIFEQLGEGASAAMLQTVVVGAVMLAFTVLAVAVVDRAGRKVLMLLGAAGMGLTLVGLGWTAYGQLFLVHKWWALAFILGYTACFSMSVGPVTWVILSEIFPTQIRGRAMGLATICLWLANYVVSLTYPMMSKSPWLLARYHQGFPFWVYAGFCLVLVIVVWRWVPETKGKTLEEIEQSWS